jgi:RNA polymerase sigma-70 factor (ECF subfamily)
MYATVELPMPTEWDFADNYREHRRRVYNLCAYLLHSRDAAEDAVHEVFLRVHRKIDSYDPALPFSNWILKVASNHCVDILRRRGKEKRLFGVDAAEIPDPSSGQPGPLVEMLSSEQGKSVRRALGSLPDKFRVPLVLAYYNEFSYDEIAEALHLPRNTVATLLFRGKQQLREKLKKEKRHEVS